MSKEATIIAGMPIREGPVTPANELWFSWLKDELDEIGIPSNNLEMPLAYKPDYDSWKEEFEKHPLTPEHVLVGHSGGAGFLIRWLSENDVEVNTVILVSPWMDEGNPKLHSNGFFDFDLDLTLPQRVKNLHILVGARDFIPGAKKTLEVLREAWGQNVTYHTIKDGGHFLDKKNDYVLRMVTQS